MLNKRVWKRLLGVEHTVLERLEAEETTAGGLLLVAYVRPDALRALRCPHCDRRCGRYDAGDGRRRWRPLDLGTVRCLLEADAPRVRCPGHGVAVAAVPWAHPGSRFTTCFEDTVAWTAAHAPFSTVTRLLRVTWRTVTGIVTRVIARATAGADRLDGLERIGIDEIAYRKGHRYLTIVVNHADGTIVWAAEGRNCATLNTFFDALGGRAAALTHVTCDGAEWIHRPVRERAPQALLCLDPFHVVKWGTDALDALRRRMAADLRRRGRAGPAAALKGTRWILIRNPGDLTGTQRTTLAGLQHTNKRLYRAYLIKEQLRQVFAARADGGRALLAGLIAWCRRCRITEFVKLGATLTRFQPLIINTLESGLSNARLEATNTHLRALTKRANGFHTPDALIAMAALTRGGLCPPLPGRL
ncbi:ISL3 family transposase [Actinomadura sp. WMMB 499]|uniref:ISL3 family transposase n=1 Tax=Actinomadura sp. WMMB 499 TaxID=1219491 RepID=UPI001245C42B|nr:ISL3 family transposase [Actinomadura sp. WMMB 499]QFG26977.1 ISL3 family transposase [Actinomadura sp. WMMB 499]